MNEQDHKIIIITAPSGAGKTSITHHLLKTFPQLAFSVSAATRQARGNEVNGKDYYFITAEQFQHHIQHNDFIEWEMVYEGKYYGTLKSEIHRIWKNNQTPLLDIDVKGAIHVQQQFPENSLSIFIQPPSVDELRKRLLSRGTETDESIQTRLNKATFELSFAEQFDKIIINEKLDVACAAAEKLIRDFLSIK